MKKSIDVILQIKSESELINEKKSFDSYMDHRCRRRRGELIWARVTYPHKWLPGVILKTTTLGVLISFFHFAKPNYFLESEVCSFEQNFKTLIRNSTREADALIDRALKLLGYRAAMALNCPCLNLKENSDPYEVADEGADCFRADVVLGFVLDVAVSPWVDEGELMDAATWLAQITTFRMYSSIQHKLLYKKESSIPCSTMGSCSDTQPLTSIGSNVHAQQSAAPIMIVECQTLSKKVENNLGHSVSNTQSFTSVSCNMHSQQSAAPIMVEGCQTFSNKIENNLRDSGVLVSNESLYEVQLHNRKESDDNERQEPSLYKTLNSLASAPFHLVAEYMNTVFRGFRILSRPIVSNQSVKNHALPNLSQTSCGEGMSGAVVPYTQQSPINRQRLKRKLDPSMAFGPQLKLFKTMPVSVFDSCLLRYISGLEAHLSDAEVTLEVQNLLSKTAQSSTYASTRGLMDLLKYNSSFATLISHCTDINESTMAEIHYKIIDTLSHYLTDTSQFKTHGPERCITILRDNATNSCFTPNNDFESVKLDSDLGFQQYTNPKLEFDHATRRNSIDGNDITASIGDDLISASSSSHCTDIAESGMAEVLNEFIDTISQFLIDTSQFKTQCPENGITIMRDDAANSRLTPDDDSEIFLLKVPSKPVELDSSLNNSIDGKDRHMFKARQKKQKSGGDDLISVKSNRPGSTNVNFQETSVNKDKSHQPSASDVSPLSSQNQQSEDLVSFPSSKTLHIKFPKDFKLPSEEELVKKFSSFGRVDRLGTKVYSFVGSAKVVFWESLDAMAAYQYAKRKKVLFGQGDVRFWLDPYESKRISKFSYKYPSLTRKLDLKSCLKSDSSKKQVEGGHRKGPENGNTIMRDDTANLRITPDDDAEIFLHKVPSEPVELDSSLRNSIDGKDRHMFKARQKKQKCGGDDLISVKSNRPGSTNVSFQETSVNKDKSHQPSTSDVSPLSSQNQQSEDLVSFPGSKTLHIKFPKDFKLPSEEELVKKFSSFGRVDRLGTKVYSFVGSAKVVFWESLDAVAAYQYAKRKKILFGQGDVRFWLDPYESKRISKFSYKYPSLTRKLDLKSCLKLDSSKKQVEGGRQKVRFLMNS